MKHATVMRASIPLLLFLFFVYLVAPLATPGYAQGAGEPVDPLSFLTWQELLLYWMPQAVSFALSVIGFVLAIALRHTIALLPDFIQAWLDAKKQRDLHSAILSKVSQLIAERRWPVAGDLTTVAAALQPEIIEEIREYIARFNPKAAEWAGLTTWTERGQQLIRTLAARKAVELGAADPLAEALRNAGAPAIDTDQTISSPRA